MKRGSGGRGDIKTRRQALSVLGLLWHKAPEPVLGLVWPLVPCGTGHCLSLAACATRHKRPVLCLVSDEAHEAKDRHTSQHGAAVSNASHVISNASCVISNASCVIELRLHVIDCVSRYGVAYLINSLSPPFPSQPLSLHADCEAGRGHQEKRSPYCLFFLLRHEPAWRRAWHTSTSSAAAAQCKGVCPSAVCKQQKQLTGKSAGNVRQ